MSVIIDYRFFLYKLWHIHVFLVLKKSVKKVKSRNKQFLKPYCHFRDVFMKMHLASWGRHICFAFACLFVCIFFWSVCLKHLVWFWFNSIGVVSIEPYCAYPKHFIWSVSAELFALFLFYSLDLVQGSFPKPLFLCSMIKLFWSNVHFSSANFFCALSIILSRKLCLASCS